MDLSKIQIESPADRPESIVLALQGILRAAGSDADYDDLAAALGVSLMFTAMEERECGDWPAYGRDAFLEETGALFGLRFRNLHPPGAAVGLESSGEFGQHFDASYKPLIVAGLSKGEPALAWMGWASACADHWGVLTRWDEATGELFGVVGFDAAGEVKLSGPAYQVYVLEEISEMDCSADALLDAAMTRAAAILNDQPASSTGILTGPPAFDHWANAFDTAAEGEDVSAGHVRNVMCLHAGRSSAIRFFRRAKGSRTEAIVEGLSRQCEIIEPFADASYLTQLLATPEGQMEFADAIRRCGEVESELATIFSD